MPDIERSVGLGFDLHVEPSKQFGILFASLGDSAITLTDMNNLHVTLVDSEETTFPIYSVRDEIALENARNECSAYLSRVVARGVILTPIDDRLHRFSSRGRCLGIEIAEVEELTTYRMELEGLFQQTAGVSIAAQRGFRPHVTIGRRKKEGSQVNGQQRSVPKEMLVDAYRMHEREFLDAVNKKEKMKQTRARKERRVLRPNPAASHH